MIKAVSYQPSAFSSFFAAYTAAPKPRSSERIQPTAQAVGAEWVEMKPRRCERIATTQIRHTDTLGLRPPGRVRDDIRDFNAVAIG